VPQTLQSGYPQLILCGFFMLGDYGRAWANKTPRKREYARRPLCGLSAPATYFLQVSSIQKYKGTIMTISSNQMPNGVYLLNPAITFQQLLEAISACLSKAEALALTAATTDFESYEPETINNFMWALSDIIRETKWLYQKAISYL
jgi:hypothetical protein